MNFKRLLYSDTGKIIIAIILGLGLATLFRKICKGNECLVFEAPNPDELDKSIYKYNKKCIKMQKNSQGCDPNKKKVSFSN